MIRSFNAGEERQEGMGVDQVSPQGESAPETTGGEKSGKDDLSFPPMDAFQEPMLSWYKNRPDLYELDKIRVEEIMPKKQKDEEKYGSGVP